MANTFQFWCNARTLERPQFHIWCIALDLILLLLTFLRSVREGDFDLYIQSLQTLIGWMFALDHINYTRWLTWYN